MRAKAHRVDRGSSPGNWGILSNVNAISTASRLPRKGRQVGICSIFLPPTRKTGVAAPCLDDLIDANILEQLTGHRIHRLENILSNEKACQGVQGTYRTYEAWQGLKDTLRIPDIVTFSSPQQLNSIIPKQPHLSHFAARCLGCPEPQSIDGSTADVLSGVLALPPTSGCLTSICRKLNEP
ncbi:hypothetical protein EDD16DRAFT_1520581 [Pisolithus croceorrhizus]|nr:hypothetical protein EV401DRAFT_1890253 [Pisolithus croceorrhizus]KAI6115631.1 hypothetical protein EDD16DRAFT_1520581 [Pisolithus croceorrhizus]KAI6160141.1 hypothetical protein EDD17DRAFT_1834510 [Pisolithus thermaeus]